MSEQLYYRFEDYLVSNGGVGVTGDWESSGPPLVRVRLLTYRILKVTPKGVRIQGGRFVLTAAHKHYACPTVEEAKESFLARKRKQIRIYKARLKNAEQAIAIVEGKDEWTKSS